MRIVCLINGGDGIASYIKTKKQYPESEIFPVHYDLGLSFSKKLVKNMPKFVRIEGMHHFSVLTEKRNLDYSPSLAIKAIFWNALAKYRANMIVLGTRFADQEAQEIKIWSEGVNASFEEDILQLPFMKDGLSKTDIIKMSMHMECLSPVLDAFTCHSKEQGNYGCGNCRQCLSKRSAIKTLGRLTRIPAPNRVSNYAKAAVCSFALDDMNGITDELLQGLFDDIAPAISELTGETELQKMAKKIRKITAHSIR